MVPFLAFATVLLPVGAVALWAGLGQLGLVRRSRLEPAGAASRVLDTVLGGLFLSAGVVAGGAGGLLVVMTAMGS